MGSGQGRFLKKGRLRYFIKLNQADLCSFSDSFCRLVGTLFIRPKFIL